jgi:hypothetical protein
MKKIFTIVLLLISVICKSQTESLQWGAGYMFSVPRGMMAENIQNVHGGYLDAYFTPKEKRYSFGLEMAANIYGHNKTRQDYSMSDGSIAPMDIIVNNSFYNVIVTTKYFLSTGNIRPFVTGKVGYTFFNTNLNIYDPDDADQCEPIDTDVLLKDGTVIFSAGVGVRWDILPKKDPGLFFINFSATMTSGGRVNFMNVDAPSHNHATHTSDVYAKFLDTQTQVVHEHHVGNVYTSTMAMADFRLGISRRIGY